MTGMWLVDIVLIGAVIWFVFGTVFLVWNLIGK